MRINSCEVNFYFIDFQATKAESGAKSLPWYVNVCDANEQCLSPIAQLKVYFNLNLRS
jgi:hypothetical protein